MAITLAEARRLLLSGTRLPWPSFGGHKGGSITLDTPGKRRLLEFLLRRDSAQVVQGNESLFPGLIAAWKNDTHDPAAVKTQEISSGTKDSWRLQRIETSGFGGLNLYGGPVFDLMVNRESWCLEGQNGSGKTSLASAILWALTGRRIREHIGPTEDDGLRAAVLDDSGAQIGEWPPLAAYPTSRTDLTREPEVWVRVTFTNKAGEVAEAYRKSVIPMRGEPVVEARVDQKLLGAPQLIETGLLMPCRLAQMGFGERSESLYEAVKILTGLDQLADIADGVANQFAHGGRRFLRYAKDQGIDGKQKAFSDNISDASKKAGHLGLDLSGVMSIETPDLAVKLKALSTQASSEAGQHLATLKSEIATTIDTSKIQGRTTIKNAVDTARVMVGQETEGISNFTAWTALTNALNDKEFQRLPAALTSAEARLDDAIRWHRRQTEDAKLRLKALAAQWFTPASQGKEQYPDCPLCDAPLLSEKQRALAKELEELKREAETAERKIEDVCSGLEKDLLGHLPADVKANLTLLEAMDPKIGYADAVLARFSEQTPFSDVLVGLAKVVREKVSAKNSVLPAFSPVHAVPALEGSEPTSAVQLRQIILKLRRLIALANWWASHRDTFRNAWSELMGEAGEDGAFPKQSIQGQLKQLELALATAEPFDEAAKHLVAATDAAQAWHRIRAEQQTREAIKEALDPLKNLRSLVEAETARSIGNLSERIEAILDRIHLRERLSYRDTVLKKKAVHVHGSFSEGMRIDAGLVANTSWLRAILWAFILALREETIEGLAANPFPLMVLDDPQSTFDPRNKRKWAEELARLANFAADDTMAMQLFLTTHEREFCHYLTDVEKLTGQQGLIAPVDVSSGTATIVNGSSLERIFDEAQSRNDDARARDYVRQVRIHAEKLLKFMLRSEGPHIPSSNLDKLRNELKGVRDKYIPPFNRQIFEDLLNSLSGGTKPVKLLNGPPHSDDETIGVAEANDVHKFWQDSLQKKIHDAFHVYANFEAFSGDSRTFTWEANVAKIPFGQKDELKKLTLLQTGIAAAAKTDGRAGDGLLTLEEWDATKLQHVRLHNHEIYQLSAGTLEPVAAIGDMVIVSNYAPVKPRDLVVAAVGDRLLARRYNVTAAHPDIAVLTGQSVDPYVIPEPVIIPREGPTRRKIVGALYVSNILPMSRHTAGHEFLAVDDPAAYWSQLDMARLFKVNGRSAEPLALDGQFLMTRDALLAHDGVDQLDGRLVVAVDEGGATYFKRLRRLNGPLVILESLNPDGTAPAELLSLDGANEIPRLTHLLPVIGVLFELPG